MSYHKLSEVTVLDANLIFEVVSQLKEKVPPAIAKAKADNAEEAGYRLLALAFTMWTQGIEPISSEGDRLIEHLCNRSDPLTAKIPMVAKDGFILMLKTVLKEKQADVQRRRDHVEHQKTA